MRIKKSSIEKITVSVIILSLLLPGCRQSSQNPVPQQQSQQTEQQPDKIPDQMKGIEDNIERTIKILDGPSIAPKEDTGKDGSQKEKTGQDTQKQGKAQSGDQGGQQSQEPKQGQAAQPPDPWQQINPIISSLHYQWNSYMPLAAKAGANKTLIDNFSTALNNFTNNILAKNKTNTLLAASSLYGYVPDFYMLYKTPTSPEIKRIRHYTRNAVLYSMAGNWNQADSDINSLKASWSLYKNILPKSHRDDSNKLDFSIYELEKVVKERNPAIIDIKGRVAMSNIELLEKSIEKSSGLEGKPGGGQ